MPTSPNHSGQAITVHSNQSFPLKKGEDLAMPAKVIVVMSTTTGPPEVRVIVHCTLEFDDDLPTLPRPESIRPFLRSAIEACR